MRVGIGMAGVLLGLGLASPAWAQLTITFGGAPQATRNVLPNLNSSVPIAQPQTGGVTKFSLGSLIPSFSGISNRRVFGHSTYPTQAQLPGLDYLKAFQFRQNQP